MNIGIDLHGTIDSNPTLFLEASKNLIACGDKVYIISGPPLLQIKEELDNLGFKSNEHYNAIISVVNFLQYNRVKMWQDKKNNWWCDPVIWWKSKARICMMYQIDALIDDKTEYQEHFDKTNTLFWLWKNIKELTYEKYNSSV